MQAGSPHPSAQHSAWQTADDACSLNEGGKGGNTAKPLRRPTVPGNTEPVDGKDVKISLTEK